MQPQDKRATVEGLECSQSKYEYQKTTKVAKRFRRKVMTSSGSVRFWQDLWILRSQTGGENTSPCGC